MEGASLIEDIKTLGYAFVELPSSHLVNAVLADFDRFMAEPIEYRVQWNFVSDKDTQWQIGFLPRTESINAMTGYPYDFKDVFHYQPNLQTKLTERQVDITQHLPWLENMQSLFETVSKNLSPLIHDIQKTYPLKISDAASFRFHGGHTMRLLRYHMRNRKEGVIGLGHVDESLVTVKVFQNIPGLRVGNKDNPQLITIPDGKNIVYPGRKAEFISNGEISPLWHDIVDTRQDINNPTKRMSIIFFADTMD